MGVVVRFTDTTHGDNMNAIAQKFIKDQKGMTLIDVAIMLLIIGILTAPMMQAYNIWKMQNIFDNNTAHFTTASNAIDNFYFTNDHYPCPADPTLGPQSAAYGEAVVDAAGNCTIGIDPTNRIATGSLPFKNLKMTPDESLDSSNNKIVYAVTLALANPATPFNNNNGRIEVMRVPDANDDDVPDSAAAQDTPQRYHFLLLSLGPNGRGAHNEAGQEVAQCANAVSTPGGGGGGGPVTQTENCDGDLKFVDSRFMKDTGATGNKFDDQIFDGYESDNSAPSRIWDTATNPDNLGSKNLYIGIGVSQPEHELEVAGNIRASQNAEDATNPIAGNTYAAYYCDQTGVNCFAAESIAGDDPNMTCSSTAAMSGIAKSAAKCGNTVSNLKAKTCPDNQFARGFDAGGNIVCGTP